LLLGILDKATLTLGDNRRVDLSQTMIFLTSNLGGGEITELMTGGMGFVQPSGKTEDKLDAKVEKTAQGAAKKKFSPEFMNRLDKVVVFHPLRQEQLEEILEIELGMVQQRVLDTGRGQFLFRVTPAARRFVLQEGTDFKYGARHLKRAIEKYVVYPLANLLATEQVRSGDMLVVDWDGKATSLRFHKEGQGAVIHVPTKLMSGAGAQAAKATGGEVVEAPVAVIVREAKAPAALPSGASPPAASGRCPPRRSVPRVFLAKKYLER
jgi:ATP-dependent Clp protease ATP-binding subunit ClpB